MDEYYLSYSGGRDSHFLLWFIKEYLHNDTIPIVAVNTRMEHSEILERIKQMQMLF
jgi:3'-phosphoadenosine 5'-phosphosulfate sulfotransferase (PAPS reductase)/FAD synthetase